MKLPKISFMSADKSHNKDGKPRVLLNIFNNSTDKYEMYLMSPLEAQKMVDGVTKILSTIEDEDSNVPA